MIGLLITSGCATVKTRSDVKQQFDECYDRLALTTRLLEDNDITINQNINLLKKLRSKKHNIGFLGGMQVDPITYSVCPEFGIMYFYSFKYLGFGFNIDVAFSDNRVVNVGQKVAFFLSF